MLIVLATRPDGGAVTGDLGAEMLGTLPTRTGPAVPTVEALRRPPPTGLVIAGLTGTGLVMAGLMMTGLVTTGLVMTGRPPRAWRGGGWAKLHGRPMGLRAK